MEPAARSASGTQRLDPTTDVSSSVGSRDDSLGRVVTELAPRLLRFARGRSAGHDAPLAEEAAQDALTALVDRWRRHGAPASPEAFAFAVLRRRLARAQARRALVRPLDALRERFGGDAVANDGSDPARRIDASDELQRLRSGLDRLSPRLREALLLVTAGELAVADAATILGISTSALKMRVSRARAQLRREIQPMTEGIQETRP
ncbi:MAG: sigma-70 family RNA polymerase sigma factor [Thermoanaerobaculia bacterium]|nr:sigma-70 family RNA polymerase sigma factor [Thermoanaerobaculia bacterium]